MPGTPNLVELQKLRLGMNKTMQELVKQTKGLEVALKQHADATLDAGLKEVRKVMKAADGAVLKGLDKALNEADPNKKQVQYKSVAKTAHDFVDLLEKDKRIRAIEDNPFFSVTSATALSKQLQSLIKMIG